MSNSAIRFAWAFGIPLLQLFVASRARTFGFVRTFLLIEACAEMGLATVNATFGYDSNLYLYSWTAGTILHHGLCAFLLAKIFNIVRLRGLPLRQSFTPLFIAAAGALAVGLRFAIISNSMGLSDLVRWILPLDHALSLSIGLMVVFLPFYVVAISSSLPTGLHLVVYGFAIYEFAYAGLLGAFITSQRLDLPNAINIVYLISLALWFIALTSSPKEGTTLLSPQPAE